MLNKTDFNSLDIWGWVANFLFQLVILYQRNILSQFQQSLLKFISVTDIFSYLSFMAGKLTLSFKSPVQHHKR